MCLCTVRGPHRQTISCRGGARVCYLPHMLKGKTRRFLPHGIAALNHTELRDSTWVTREFGSSSCGFTVRIHWILLRIKRLIQSIVICWYYCFVFMAKQVGLDGKALDFYAIQTSNFILQCFVLPPVSVRTNKQKTNSMVWVRERTIPTERPPLVGEVIANICG
jgi:hypothetical protein